MADTLRQIRSTLESRGYMPIPDAPVEGKGDIWYRHRGTVGAISHLLHLSYKPSGPAYSISAGINDVDVRRAIEEKLPHLYRFISPGVLAWPALRHSPCWHMFDAGRALQWGTLLVTPIPSESDSWPDQIDSLFADFLEPVFFGICEPRDMVELLLRNDRPFEWFTCVPVFRMAEIVRLGFKAGLDPTLLRARIDSFRTISERGIPKKRYEDAIEAIFDQLYP